MMFRLIVRGPLLASTLALTGVLSGCASALHAAQTAVDTPSSQRSGIVGYRWQIAEVRHGTTHVTVPTSARGYIAFSPNGILNADDGVNHLYGHFAATANGYRAAGVGTTLVGYGGHDPVTLALIEGIRVLTMQNVEVVVERRSGERLDLSAGGYHIAVTRAGREPVRPTSAPPTNIHS